MQLVSGERVSRSKAHRAFSKRGSPISAALELTEVGWWPSRSAGPDRQMAATGARSPAPRPRPDRWPAPPLEQHQGCACCWLRQEALAGAARDAGGLRRHIAPLKVERFCCRDCSSRCREHRSTRARPWRTGQGRTDRPGPNQGPPRPTLLRLHGFADGVRSGDRPPTRRAAAAVTLTGTTAWPPALALAPEQKGVAQPVQQPGGGGSAERLGPPPPHGASSSPLARPGQAEIQLDQGLLKGPAPRPASGH